jgi:hypothetical protein
MPKLTTDQMILEALAVLNDGKKGSSRQSLWKCINTNFPETANYKQFLVRLKKMAANPLSHVQKAEKSHQKFVMDKMLHGKILYAKKSGKPVQATIRSVTMMKPEAAKKKIAKTDAKKKSEKKGKKDMKKGQA